MSVKDGRWKYNGERFSRGNRREKKRLLKQEEGTENIKNEAKRM